MYSYPHKSAYLPVERSVVEPYLAALAGKQVDLYLHVPFCRSKCAYCNLFSVPCGDERIFRAYFAAVERQVQQLERLTGGLKKIHFRSLTLGGGTPTLLPATLLREVLERIERHCNVNPARAHSAIELSPTDAGPAMLDFLQAAGFRRLSIGVQSFADAELKTLGRYQSIHLIHGALEGIAQRAFAGFNIDLIYGIPGQGPASWLASLRQALDYAPSELFLYPLYARPCTGLAGLRLDGQSMLAMYRLARDLLLDKGYRQISMRRFVRDDNGGTTQEKNNKNAKSCGFERTLALGCGGRSYLGDLHLCQSFAADTLQQGRILDDFITKNDFMAQNLSAFLLNEDEHRRRYIIKNLLHASGVDRQHYQTIFKTQPEQDFLIIHQLIEQNLLKKLDGRFCLSEQGLEQSDRIGPLFISDAVAARSAAFCAQQANGAGSGSQL